ncbi:proline dehydrogenase family protein [Flammeovirga kamogawensis]|uniref:Proline dehydrogenase family protein n=1 Tax=Flammeovirga kamogawensis TaxID=373891 RepID=A0ABX8GY03_9BACT|nr:proline dehydrogenase family protein [Flammeovirga kamogawensis]MBB6460867.1 proline dehydrogenase [Flammeovirga kamogawensis]QWG08213.1 proline dehydrogenase family protein [Flammeovirga kamogawensis]TRX70017.1 proline dehydrogenase [Flammeovirga kamogawensis]
MVDTSTVNFENTQTAFAWRNNAELKQTYALFTMMHSPGLVKFGTSLLNMAFTLRLPIKTIVKMTLFKQFCGGETIEDSSETIDKLGSYHIGSILDYSVEGAQNDKSFDKTEAEIIKTIKKSAQDDNVPFSVFKLTGIAAVDLLEKVHAGEILSGEDELQWNKVVSRVKNLCKTAYDHNVRIFIDAEETWLQDPVDQLVYDMMRLYNKETAIVYNTYQMYLKSKLEQLKSDFEKAQEEGFILGVKLVRGAYMEKEGERAQKMNYPNPIQDTKEATDKDYNAAIAFIMENNSGFALCAGSHNEKSNHLLVELMNKYGIADNNVNFFFAQLFGMSDHISFNLSKAGYNVAKYLPYGPVKEALPYLFRRAEENTSVAGQASRELTLVSTEIKRRSSEK